MNNSDHDQSQLSDFVFKIPVTDRKWNRADWYDVMQTVCHRLNKLVKESDTLDHIMSTMFRCSPQDSLDMLSLGSDYYLTNLCSIINGFIAFRDNKLRTYRIAPVFTHTSYSDHRDPAEDDEFNKDHNEEPNCGGESPFCKDTNKSVHKSLQNRLSHFVVTVKPSSEEESVFPLLGE